jgi:hypothetical protein
MVLEWYLVWIWIMSDRSNRDIGRKREYKKHSNLCGCWHCERGAVKKKIKEERAKRKEIQKMLGYSRIGSDNI